MTDSIFKADESGIYLGNSSFSNAPFKVDPTGKMTASNIDVTGGKLKIGNNFNVDASGNATLNNASINGNINMSGGSISWANISSDPATTAAASAASTAQSSAGSALATAIALANGTYQGNNTTFIDGRKVQSAEIIGGKLIGGTIESGTTISVGTDARIGNKLYVGMANNNDTKAIYLTSNSTHMGQIIYDPDDRVISFSAQNGANFPNGLSTNSMTVSTGGIFSTGNIFGQNLYMNNDIVATRDWVNTNATVTAVFK